jgi:hypothetical protein
MASSSPNTIILKCNGVRKEGIASGAITPGHLVEFGGANDLQVHSNAALNARKAFAVENDLIGNGITDAYALGDQVQYEVFYAGAEVYALVAAAATAITKGAALESAGDGTLRILTTDAATDDTQRDSVVAYALEAVDNSGGASAARIKVEVA